MAVVVEDGTGKADAEVYADVATVSAYLTKRGRNTAWDALTATQAEAALIRATDYIDRRWSYIYDPLLTTQALCFPRSGGIGLPQAVINACAELTERAQTTTLMPDPTYEAGGRVRRSQKKVGPIEKELEYEGARAPLPRFPVVERLLLSYRADATLYRA